MQSVGLYDEILYYLFNVVDFKVIDNDISS
jgi:hypothetical protein